MRWMCLTIMLTLAVLASGCATSKPLFNGKDLAGWVEVESNGAWTVADGVLRCNGQKRGYAWLSTDRMYRDFELTLETRIEPGTNAGVFLRAPNRTSRISQTGLEVQIKDDQADQDLTDVSGSVFSRIPAAGKFARPVGEWNRLRITCVGRRLRIELNGQLCCDTDINTVKSGTEWAMDKVPDEGYIGLQNHGTPVELRNIRIRELQ